MQTLTYDGQDVDIRRLDAEIQAAGIVRGTRYFGASEVEEDSGHVHVFVADDWTPDEQATLDSVLAIHVAIPVAHTLEDDVMPTLLAGLEHAYASVYAAYHTLYGYPQGDTWLLIDGVNPPTIPALRFRDAVTGELVTVEMRSGVLTIV